MLMIIKKIDLKYVVSYVDGVYNEEYNIQLFVLMAIKKTNKNFNMNNLMVIYLIYTYQ